MDALFASAPKCQCSMEYGVRSKNAPSSAAVPKMPRLVPRPRILASQEPVPRLHRVERRGYSSSIIAVADRSEVAIWGKEELSLVFSVHFSFYFFFHLIISFLLLCPSPSLHECFFFLFHFFSHSSLLCYPKKLPTSPVYISIYPSFHNW